MVKRFIFASVAVRKCTDSLKIYARGDNVETKQLLEIIDECFIYVSAQKDLIKSNGDDITYELQLLNRMHDAINAGDKPTGIVWHQL